MRSVEPKSKNVQAQNKTLAESINRHLDKIDRLIQELLRRHPEAK